MNTEKSISLSVLEGITDGFSVHSRIGMGGYGNVYKGVYNGKEIAIKLLNVDVAQGLDDKKFKNEVGNLLRAEHSNIVQLVGYCYEIKKLYIDRSGAPDFSEHIYRVICFEYLHGGSLDKCLYGKSFAPNWSTRYYIIKGICEGVNFLHGLEPPILHLDLKPANILLDHFMVPKVADFGLSRVFNRSHTNLTENPIGTRKYMPPEFIAKGEISTKNDIFSLGVVMIEIMAGCSGYSDYTEIDTAQLMLKVLTRWGTLVGDDKHQVQTCIELAIRCVDSQRDNRPSTTDILGTLNTTESHMPMRVKRHVCSADLMQMK